MKPSKYIPLLLSLPPTHSAPTDSPHDADIPQSSYLGGTHNISPSDLPHFTHLWNHTFASTEKHWARPLVYTLRSTNRQIVFTASTENRIRTFDAATGELIHERQVQPAWPTGRAFCEQVGETIGVVGTGVVRVEDGSVFFFVKSYIEVPGGAAPPLNAVTYLYGVDLETLQDLPDFPLFVDGIPADNDARRVFLGGLMLQRPALLLLGDVLYAGFGGLCDGFNYTGTILTTNLRTLTTHTWTTISGPSSPHTQDWTAWHGGGAAGIWQAGMGLSSDGDSVFFTVDNGYFADTNTNLSSGAPQSGKSHTGILSETVTKIKLNEKEEEEEEADEDGQGGKGNNDGIELEDFFRPADFQLDSGQDIGSGSFALLPSFPFSTEKLSTMGIATSTNPKMYILNVQNLGGYRMGSNGTDHVLQTIPLEGEVFGGIGTYPLEGGYIYVNPGNAPLSAFKFTHPAAAAPSPPLPTTAAADSEDKEEEEKELFTLAGISPLPNPHYQFVGVPTVTSYEDQEGTGIVWVTDVERGLLAYRAVPENGSLVELPLPRVEGAVKYSRPVFGDGRVYMFDGRGRLIAMGVK
ncbi:hypothetical protein NX059_008359 [Plenodomus lindquistii]|nr:hypothetical protein NX059_008359 [Plenodomus lindquistii]